MVPKHPIEAALFDLDGVVVFTDKYHTQAWDEMAAGRGWEMTDEVRHHLRGVPRMAALEVILRHNNVTLPDEEKEALAHAKNEDYKVLLKQINEEDVYPGVVEFIKALRERGIKIGLCSSSKNARTVLEALDLTHLFDAIVTGDDFKNGKPDPEIFLLGAERVGVPAFHCVVFEDAPSGVEAGLAAKMRTIGVGDPAGLPDAPSCIQRYEEIDIDALLDTGRPHTFASEPWHVSETVFEPKRAKYWETIFALTNGLLGLRGTYEEDDPDLAKCAEPGMYVNGIYGYEPYKHIVAFPGYPEHRHAMLNLCDWRIIHLYLGEERFSLFEGKVSDYRRSLDMERGVTVRSLTWESPSGKQVRIEVTRLVSMVRRHSAAIRYQVTPLNFSGELTLESVIRGKVPSHAIGGEQLEIVEQIVRDELLYLEYSTTNAPFTVAAAFGHSVAGDGIGDMSGALESGDGVITHRLRCTAREGLPVMFDKHACFHSNVETPRDDMLDEAKEGLWRDQADDFEVLLKEQAAFWSEYWKAADIEIDGPVGDQQATRFAMFHLRQSNPEDDRRSISACGMTGDHYWGHVFWDTEMYIAPHFIYTQPETVRSLLMYRYHLLDRARERAVQMGGKGALFSWNSISGEECGIIYEASTAEYHLVSAVAQGIRRYVEATGDEGFLFDHGAEIMFETARFLADRGAYVAARQNRFCINVVCGPDEYGCGISNNCYTNMMAQWHFQYAAQVHERMAAAAPDKLKALEAKIGLGLQEREDWLHAADNMYVPYNEALGIHMQDDSFLYLDPVDMSKIPRNTDLREMYHPLNLWRMQVAKQADVVLLMLVMSDQFTLEQKRANFDYYEPRTNHGSSLSPSIHSVLASEIGRLEDAYLFFRYSAFMDLNDFKNNTSGGVHSACLGGTWMAVVQGFAGMRDQADGLLFNPRLPQAWSGYRFTLVYQGRRLRVEVGRDGVRYRLLEGDALSFCSGASVVRLDDKQSDAQCPLVED